MDTVEIAPVAEASFPLIKTEIETCLGLTGDSMAPRIPPVNNREERYRNWLDWVTTNLGRDQHLAGVAATAATDAAELGNGFNVAVKAATAAWSEAAKATRTGTAQALTRQKRLTTHGRSGVPLLLALVESPFGFGRSLRWCLCLRVSRTTPAHLLVLA